MKKISICLLLIFFFHHIGVRGATNFVSVSTCERPEFYLTVSRSFARESETEQQFRGDLSTPVTNVFSRQTNKLLPEPQASLLNGILWGEQKAMPKDFYEALRRTGTLHVIALSGMNISILIVLMAQTTLFLGRKKSVIISLIGIIAFIGFVGASASVVRAGIMGGLSLLAIYFGKKSWALLSLILAAGVMLIINFSWLTNIGFQLSFLATLGIILFAGEGKRENGLITDLRTTLAAQVFTLPVILYNFKQLSLVAPFTNVVVLWVVQPIMILGFFLSLLAAIFWPLAYPLAWIIWVPLTFFIKIVELTAKIPLAAINF